VFTGAYPLARIDFEDGDLPVQVRLEAFSPFIPLNEQSSGMPIAVLRYTVKNTGPAKMEAAIAFSVANPIGGPGKSRVVEHRRAEGIEGLLMTNPGAAATEPESGSLALAVLDSTGGPHHAPGWLAAW
jgi:uncharacterized protein (DUF608 family)